MLLQTKFLDKQKIVFLPWCVLGICVSSNLFLHLRVCIFASVFVFPAVAPHFHDWDICHFAFAHRQQASTSSSSVKTSNGTFLKMRESVVNMMGQGENGYKLKMVGRVGEPDDGHWMQIISLLSSSKIISVILLKASKQPSALHRRRIHWSASPMLFSI